MRLANCSNGIMTRRQESIAVDCSIGDIDAAIRSCIPDSMPQFRNT